MVRDVVGEDGVPVEVQPVQVCELSVNLKLL